MTKKEFLERLEYKLRVLSKEEIQDILDEYSGYLDNKINEGKSEEEAVKDFGNLNDLASEILSAYKLNDSYTKDKVGGIIDNLVDVTIHVIDSMTTFFKEKAPQMSIEDLVRLGVYVIIGLIFIAILKIPFSIIEGLLKGIVSGILPWFLSSPLRLVISIAINLIYLCIAIMLVANFIRTATEDQDFTLKGFLRKPLYIHVDMQQTFQSLFKKEPSQKRKENQQQATDFQQEVSDDVQQEQPDSDELIDKQDEEISSLKEDKIEKEEEPQLFQFHQPKQTAEYEDDPQYQRELHDIKKEARAEWEESMKANKKKGNPISSLFLLLLQIITCLVLFPFFLVNAGCCLAFGIGIFLLFSGAKIWGLVFVLGGLIGVLSEFMSFLWKAVRPGSKQRKGRLISFLASIVFIGAGLTLSIVEFSKYETLTFDQYLAESNSSVEKVEAYSLTNSDFITFKYLNTPIGTEVSNGDDDELELVFTLNDAYSVTSYYNDSDTITYQVHDFPQTSRGFQLYKIAFNALRDQVFLVKSDSRDLAYSVTIRANQKTLDKLQISDNTITIQK